jgi:archaellum component FlaC
MAKGGSSGGSPNQVLIIFLVFFVLASIALGVTTYLGFDGQTQLLADKQTAVKKEQQAQADREWFQFQDLFYRQVVGEKLNDDDKKAFSTLRDRFISGDLQGKTSDPRKDDAIKTMKTVLDNPDLFGPNPDAAPKDQIKKDLAKAFPDVIKDKQKAYDTLVAGELKQTKEALDQANKDLEGARAALKLVKDAYDAAAKKAEADVKAGIAKAREDIQKLQEQVASLGADIAKLTEEKGTLTEEGARKVATLSREVTKLQQLLKDIKDAKERDLANAIDYDQPKGKIILIGGDGSMPHINLGSADNLKPGVTFSVYGVGIDGKPISYPILDREGKTMIGPDGKPEKEGKATVEVLAVVGPHQAQVRVTSLRDPAGDPILRGDLIFNPGWDPNHKQHVAIAGFIDLTGEGRDELPELMRMLEKGGVIVDAYLDIREGAIKGPGITRETDYLILGGEPTFVGADRAKDDDPRVAKLNELSNLRTKMQDDAAKNGVTVISLRKFLLLSGFKTTRANYNTKPTSGVPSGY